MAMLKLTVRRCTVFFSRINHFSRMAPLFPNHNSFSSTTQNIIGIFLQSGMRLSGNMDYRVHCMSSKAGTEGQMSARLMQMQQVLEKAESRAVHANEPIPKVTLEHVTVGFARSGGPGGQNVNKVNTKVDMRFNVMAAGWLPLRIRERILQMEKNRINRDGEIVVSSTKSRTQKGNIEDALGKLQAIIDAAAYVPPPPTEQKIKKIIKMAEVGEQKRLQTKKAQSLKKSVRRNKRSWD